MYAIRKADMKAFCPDAYSVCRVEHGSTNPYLTEERAIEDFLKGVEPKYSRAVANLAAGTHDLESVYTLSGFIAYVLTCSPGGMRINSEPFRGAVEETGRLLDARGEVGAPPSELGRQSLSELFDDGVVTVDVDPKYPQAVGVASIHRMTNTFGNFGWEVLLNEHADSPFFTSDLPVSIESTADPRIINRLIPLSPTVAVRLHPNILQDTAKVDFSFSGFRYKRRTASRQEVSKVNTQLVRGAETTVFFRDNREWVEKFVHKNAPYRIEPLTQRIPHGEGTLLWSTLKIRKL